MYINYPMTKANHNSGLRFTNGDERSYRTIIKAKKRPV